MIRVMDVEDQTDEEWPISHWVDYYNLTPSSRKRIYNVISIEFTHTKLEHMVQSPEIARKLDWVQFWPAEFKDPTIQLRGKMSFPKVQHYCLMGVEGSYTDFHIDFGGTSVWYHVVKGRKTFCLIPPTEGNLKRYEEWISSPNQDQTFFADIVPAAIVVTVNAGNSLLIPTGWIHAVYTPIDSFVFGGNFLHSFNMKLQLDVVHLELRSKIRRKFRFPYFEETNWYAIENYVNKILTEAKRAGAKPAKEASSNLKAKSPPPNASLPTSSASTASASLINQPHLQAQLWNAFQRTGLPANHFAVWAEQVISYGESSPLSGAPTGASQTSNSNTPGGPSLGAVNRNTPSPRPPGAQGSGSYAGKMVSNSSSSSSFVASSGGSSSGGSDFDSSSSTLGGASASSSSSHLPGTSSISKERRSVFAKGDPIDDSWLSIWEREGLISILDWLPIAKELFPWSIYNQPGGPGKAQYYIDVLTCFLRRLPLPPLADYLKLHASDPSPYDPATVICKVCLSEEVPEGVSETWIGCDYCSHWWHAACLGLSSQQAEAMEAYFCSECRPIISGLRRVSRDFYNWVINTPPHLLPAPKMAPSLPYPYGQMSSQMMSHPAMMGPNGVAMMQNPALMLPSGNMSLQPSNPMPFPNNAGSMPYGSNMSMQNMGSNPMSFPSSSGSLPHSSSQSTPHMNMNHHNNTGAGIPGNFPMPQNFGPSSSGSNYPYHPGNQNPSFPPLQLSNANRNMGHPPHSPHSSQSSPHSVQSPHLMHSPHMNQYPHTHSVGHMNTMPQQMSQMPQMSSQMAPPVSPHASHPQSPHPSAYNQHPMMNTYPYGGAGTAPSNGPSPRSSFVSTTPPPTASNSSNPQSTPHMVPQHMYNGSQPSMDQPTIDSIEAQHQALLQQQQQQLYHKQFFQMQQKAPPQQQVPYQGTYPMPRSSPSPMPSHAYPMAPSSSPIPPNVKLEPGNAMPQGPSMNTASHDPSPPGPQPHVSHAISDERAYNVGDHVAVDHPMAANPALIDGNEEPFQEGSSTVKRAKLEENA